METISARVLADSISPRYCRLTTLEVVMPRFVLAEFNTHRMFSRNSASSRAIPVARMLQRVQDSPFVPIYWGKQQKGMQASEEVKESDREFATSIWLQARDDTIKHVRILLDVGIHKQIANRLLEPFLYHVVIVTATEWDNFFHLRIHADAQPEIRAVAIAMRDAIQASEPVFTDYLNWHMPWIFPNDRNEIAELSHNASTDIQQRLLATISAARCARVSYLTHDSGKREIAADLNLYQRLVSSGHCSPLEHAAQAALNDTFYDNLRGWQSLRYQTPGQADILRPAVV